MRSATATRKDINIYFCPSRRGSAYYDLEAIGTKSGGLETVFVGCDTALKEKSERN